MNPSPLLIGLLLVSTTACRRPPAPAPPVEAALERLDTRTPVPLLPHMAQHQKENMREHLLAVQNIALAAARGDFGAIEQASRELGLSPGMERMCQHMGKGAPGFTEQALAFHRSADEIAAAARKHDTTGVMSALGSTLQRCTGCHATFRQKVVDETSWGRLTETTAAGTPGISGG